MPEELTRREILRLGALGTGGLVALTGWRRTRALTSGTPSAPRRAGGSRSGAELVFPPEVRSANGVLATAITAAKGATTINGESVAGAYTYNGEYPGATWRVRPGDVFRVQLTNELDSLTNLHWHGMHVSPNGNADNVFLQVDPSETLDFEVPVPANHPAGLYWYHPHYHTMVDEQVYNGMAGLIVVDGGWRDLAGIAEASEKLLALKSIVIEDGRIATETSPTTTNELWTVNGLVKPRITVRPGERQLWSIANLSNDAFFRVALQGHSLLVVATDGVGVIAPFEVSDYTLPPAGRVEVIVEPGDPGSYKFQNLQVNEGFERFDQRTLATMVVQGEPVTGLPPIPDTIVGTLEDLSALEPDVYRNFTFDHEEIVVGDASSSNPLWLINGDTFNASRVDVRARLGAMEEWRLRNIDSEDHPFHIHQNDFQVTEINGVAQPFRGYNDTAIIPRGGQIKIRQRYTDFTGRWVYHCHILFHEDHGMMGTVEVVDEGGSASVGLQGYCDLS